MVASILPRWRTIPGSGEEAGDVGFAPFGDDLGVEAFEGRAEAVAFAEDGDPGEAGLEAVEHEFFPERPAVAFRHAPFGVVIGLVERVPDAPVAAFGHG